MDVENGPNERTALSGSGHSSGGSGQKRRRGRAKSLVPEHKRRLWLEYKAQRGLCLIFFDIIHTATVVAAILAAFSQVLDMAYLWRNQEAQGPLTGAEVWALVQAVALRAYGVIFTLSVCLMELSEIETCGGLMKNCCCCFQSSVLEQASMTLKHWFVRGVSYIFVGLFVLESSRQYVDADETSPMFDDPRAMAVIRCSGTVLMATGALYTIMGLCWCRELKMRLLKDLKKNQDLLQEHLDTGRTKSGALVAPGSAGSTSSSSSEFGRTEVGSLEQGGGSTITISSPVYGAGGVTSTDSPDLLGTLSWATTPTLPQNIDSNGPYQ